ncbi:hypothetical protein EVAR_78523_1 [Eumeta japonica]|uniref:Uncharacterized protein n=1 Tax=Eumeta variegata TaxID=151549 RepID=A0A4C1ZVQ9_EUMVA|nr:hypothetical protein EVAR_78523_1 [Eumeta japonica]
MEGGRATPGIGEEHSKAGGPRSVRVCRSLKGKGQRPGSLQITLVDTVSCGLAAAALRTRSAGPGGSRAAICTKANSLVRALGAGAR